MEPMWVQWHGDAWARVRPARGLGLRRDWVALNSTASEDYAALGRNTWIYSRPRSLACCIFSCPFPLITWSPWRPCSPAPYRLPISQLALLHEGTNVRFRSYRSIWRLSFLWHATEQTVMTLINTNMKIEMTLLSFHLRSLPLSFIPVWLWISNDWSGGIVITLLFLN